MKKLAILALLVFGSAGCYSETEVLFEGGRPVEIHLQGMDNALYISIPEIDGCDYCFIHTSRGNASFVRVFHYEKCHNCENRTWPDGKEPVKSVDVRDLGTYYVYPLEVDGHEYFTVRSWSSIPEDIVHRGHCKACAKKKF